jgi:hypothetical protein
MERIQSNKNALQEYYQRNVARWGSDGKQILPVYEHYQSAEGWVCVLTLPDSNRQFEAVGRNKKEADQRAASLALADLSGITTPITPLQNQTPPLKWSVTSAKESQFQEKYDGISWRLPGCVLVLIDLENSPNHDKRKWNGVRWDCSRVEAFVGKLSSHATKDLQSLYPFVTKFHIVNSGHRDAVDHAISARAGEWVEAQKHPDYYLEREEGCLYDDCIYIVSRDRFAPALVDVLNQKLAQTNKKKQIAVVHAINIDECFDLLDTKASGQR